MKLNKGTIAFSLGLATGLLFAPVKGRKLRKNISNSANYVYDKIVGIFTSKEDELKDLQNLLADDSNKLETADRIKLLKLLEDVKTQKKS